MAIVKSKVLTSVPDRCDMWGKLEPFQIEELSNPDWILSFPPLEKKKNVVQKVKDGLHTEPRETTDLRKTGSVKEASVKLMMQIMQEHRSETRFGRMMKQYSLNASPFHIENKNKCFTQILS